MAADVEWILFDLNGTLLDPRAIARTWSDDPNAGDAALAALDVAVAQAMADTIVGEFRPFPDYLRAALAQRIPDSALDDALEAARQMPPMPGAREAVEELAARMRVGVLTNSATDSAEQALEAAGLSEPLTLVLGVDEVRRYKPHPEVYRHALARTGAAGDAVMLAAAHWWDVHGAKRAGLRTCWIGHKETRLLDTADEPDVTVADVRELPQAIAEEAA